MRVFDKQVIPVRKELSSSGYGQRRNSAVVLSGRKLKKSLGGGRSVKLISNPKARWPSTFYGFEGEFTFSSQSSRYPTLIEKQMTRNKEFSGDGQREERGRRGPEKMSSTLGALQFLRNAEFISFP